MRRKRRDKAFQNERRFAGAGNARNNGQAAFRNIHFERLHRMDAVGGKVNSAVLEKLAFGCFLSRDALLSRQKRANLRVFVYLNVICCALRDDMAAFCTGFRAHFNEPVGLAQNLRVMVYQNNRIAIRYKIVHNTCKSDNIRWVQTD